MREERATGSGPGGIALMLAFLAGALGGFAASVVTGPEQDIPTQALPDDGRHAELMAALSELTRAVGQMRPRLSSVPGPAEAEPREAAEPMPVPGTDAIAALVERIDMLLARQRPAVAGDDAMPRNPSDPALIRTARETLFTREQQVLEDALRLQTMQQVLDTYGPPTRVHIDDRGRMRCYYTSLIDDKFQVGLVFFNGLLVDVY